MRALLIATCLAPAALHAQPAEEEALIRAVFATLQPISITENVEFCGYVGFDAAGMLVASNATRGNIDSCLANDPVNIEVITASYHTHGAFTPDYFNEVPSGTDMEGDEDEGIDGWVATPGGRLWYIDTDTMVTFQICGLGCLPSDPNFVAGDMGVIAESYAYEDLVTLLDE
ncbi:DUF4329 domain-containing protein [Yoonia sp. SS1-5]|uniref:DUF4329 domain-containing protein n=1 Tax=Yoonia rhodophyticola TaxID=3137370 RepID=A0AAN0M9V7_9RHOB